MNRILIICEDQIGNKIAGTGQRYLEIAKALSQKYRVSLLANFAEKIKVENVEIINIPLIIKYNWKICISFLNPKFIQIMKKDWDCIITQGVTTSAFGRLHKIKSPCIFDLYCPYFLEQLEAAKNTNSKFSEHFIREIKSLIHKGNFFICANEKQRDFYLGLLVMHKRQIAKYYQKDPSLKNLIDIVPSGISSIPPQKTKAVLKGVHPKILKNDKIILWSGGLWDWLDPITVIKAFYAARKTNSNLKLVFLGVKHPHAKTSLPQMAQKAIKLCQDLKIYQESALFIDWIPYDDRQNYLLESDLGIVSQTNTLETRFSWRIKVLDYFWAQLPIITNEGDSMADLIKTHNMGRVIPIADSNAMAQAIISLLNNEQEYQQIKQNIKNFIPNLYWENVIKPIERFINAKS